MGVKLGDLEILDMVATGGMAEVYRARLGGRLLAIKRILPQFTRERELVQMFVDEAKVASRIRHDNVIRVYDLALTDGGEFYILMEFADGRDLADLMYAAGLKAARFNPALSTYVARQVLAALEYAHQAADKDGRPMELIHRDISPHNVMVGFDGWVKLTDFGIAKVQHSKNQTVAGVVKGKFGYMSPEQARGKKLDGRSDLYNVGILLYEMLTGDRLFTGASDISTLDRMRAAEVPPLPPSLGCPTDLEVIIRKALSKGADDRFATAAAFDAALAECEQRCGLHAGTEDLSRVVTGLFGSGRKPPPDEPSRPPVAIRSATAQTVEDSELLSAPQPPPPPNPTRPVVVSGSRQNVQVSSTVRSSLPQVPTTARTASADDVPAASPRVSGSRVSQQVAGAVRTTLPQVGPLRTSSVPTTPVARTSSVAALPAAAANPFDAASGEESTRFDHGTAGAAAQVVMSSPRSSSRQNVVAPGPAAIQTRGAAQPLPTSSSRVNAFEGPPQTMQESAPTARPASEIRIGGTGLRPLSSSQNAVLAPAIYTSARLEPLPDQPATQPPPAAAPEPTPRVAPVWSEPSLNEESARMGARPANAEAQAQAGAETNMLDVGAIRSELAPPPHGEGDKEQRKREAMERLRAKKAAKAVGQPPPGSDADGASADAPPADEDDDARRKREALERIRAKKAAKAAAAGDASPSAQVAAGLPAPSNQEWRTTPDAPPSAPHPKRAGKVLDQPLESYDADARPLARRRAWIIGEPGISPVGQNAGARRRDLMRTVLPGTARRRTVVLLLASMAAGYLLAAHQGSRLARLLGSAAPYLLANVSPVPLPARGTVTLTVRTAPPGLRVFLDDVSLEGRSPLTTQIKLAPGEHRVLAVHGSKRRQATFSVQSADVAAVVYVPLAADTEVQLRLADLPDATAFLDGRPLPPDTQHISDVSRDRPHLLMVQALDRTVVDLTLLPNRPARTVVQPVAEPGSAQVVVVSQPRAQVYEGDTMLAQTTGMEPLKLSPGRHTLSLRVPALHIRHPLSIEVSSRATRRYYVDLAE